MDNSFFDRDIERSTALVNSLLENGFDAVK